MRNRQGQWIDEAALLILALAVRLLHGLAVRGEPMWGFPLVDESLYWSDAVRIASGEGSDPVFYRPPLLAWFLAAAIRLFGAGPSGARFLLLALSAFAAPLTARLARPIAGRGAALLAGLFAALYAPAIFYGGELLPATLALLLNVLFLLALRSAEEKGPRFWFAAAGFLLGLSALAWPVALVFVPFLLVRYRKERRGALLLLAGALVAVLPAFLHNLRGGDPVLVSSNGGINFYMGNHEGADGRSARAPELPNEPGEARRVAAEIAERSAGRSLAPSEVSAFWTRRGVSWILSDPGGATLLLIRKIYVWINDRDVSDNIDFAATAEISPPLRLVPFRFGLLFALALPGLAILGRSRGGRLLLLYGAVLSLAVVPFFVVGRFRLPLLPLLAIGASAGLLSIAKAVRVRPGRAAVPLLVVALALFLSGTSLFGIDEDRTWHYHYLRGDALYRLGDSNGAIAAFEESIRRNGEVPMTMNALGYLYASAGVRLDRAEELTREAIRREPARRRFYLDSLGLALLRQGKLDEAGRAFEEALALYAPEEGSPRAETLLHLAEVDSLRALAAGRHPR